MIAVVDTNVLVSGMINPFGHPGRIVDLLRSGELRLGIDDRIVAEYADVLRRPELAACFAASDVDQILEYVRGNSEWTIATRPVADLPDPSDAPFLEVAETLGIPLITGNTRHFPEAQRGPVTAQTPAEFMGRWRPSED